MHYYQENEIPSNIPDGDYLHELEIRKHLRPKRGACVIVVGGVSYGSGAIEYQPEPIPAKGNVREFGDFLLALNMGEAMGGRLF